MTLLGRGRWQLGITVCAGVLAVGLMAAMASRAPAQQLAGANRNPNGVDLAQGAQTLPPPPPQGAWGEVIMANSKWLVLQNHQGQQFPIATDAIGQFLIRWPITVRDLTPESIAEAIGEDLGGNVVQTEHVDIFEGQDQRLVTPTFMTMVASSKVWASIDPTFNQYMSNDGGVGAQNYTNGWSYPMMAGMYGRVNLVTHVVGNVVGISPLQISILATNRATVEPVNPATFTMTQVTRGDTAFAEKGDLVYLMPTNLTPRSVTLSQLVLYKKMPLRQFRLP